VIKQKAYWIDPRGTIIPVPMKHINLISSNPKKFGLTKEYITQIYAKHKERLGLEGKAREEIMVNLMSNGWIRLRHHPKTEWIAQLKNLGRREKDYLFDFAVQTTDGTLDKMSPYTGMKIMDYKGVIQGQGDLASVLNFKMFECTQEHKLTFMLIEDYAGVGESYLTFGDYLKEQQ